MSNLTETLAEVRMLKAGSYTTAFREVLAFQPRRYSLGARCLAEGLGMCITISIGEAIIANALLARTKGHDTGWGAISLGFAFAFGISIWAFSHISAGLNPAQLIANWVLGEIGVGDFFALFAAELLGSFLGAVIVWLIYLPHWKTIPEPIPEGDDNLLRTRDFLSPNALKFVGHKVWEVFHSDPVQDLGYYLNVDSTYKVPRNAVIDELLGKDALKDADSDSGHPNIRRRSVQVADMHRRRENLEQHGVELVTEPLKRLSVPLPPLPPADDASYPTAKQSQGAGKGGGGEAVSKGGVNGGAVAADSAEGGKAVKGGADDGLLEADSGVVKHGKIWRLMHQKSVQSAALMRSKQDVALRVASITPEVPAPKLTPADVETGNPIRHHLNAKTIARLKGYTSSDHSVTQAQYATRVALARNNVLNQAADDCARLADQHAKLSVFATRPAINSWFFNFVAEFMGTTALVLGAMLLIKRGQQIYPTASSLYTSQAAFIISWFLFLLILGLGGPTGFAANPARDLGPRIAHFILPISNKGPSEWLYAPIPVFAPLLGGLAAAGLYKAITAIYRSAVSLDTIAGFVVSSTVNADYGIPVYDTEL